MIKQMYIILPDKAEYNFKPILKKLQNHDFITNEEAVRAIGILLRLALVQLVRINRDGNLKLFSEKNGQKSGKK
jgi:hypothetical protein